MGLYKFHKVFEQCIFLLPGLCTYYQELESKKNEGKDQEHKIKTENDISDTMIVKQEDNKNDHENDDNNNRLSDSPIPSPSKKQKIDHVSNNNIPEDKDNNDDNNIDSDDYEQQQKAAFLPIPPTPSNKNKLQKSASILSPSSASSLSSKRNNTDMSSSRNSESYYNYNNTTPKKGDEEHEVDDKNILTEDDIKIATRRITCSICAFGGTILSEDKKNEIRSYINEVKESDKEASIFRTTDTKGDNTNNAPKSYYEKILNQRFYESENHLSWENEEHPPIELISDDDDNDNNESNNSINKEINKNNNDMTVIKKEDDNDDSKENINIKDDNEDADKKKEMVLKRKLSDVTSSSIKHQYDNTNKKSKNDNKEDSKSSKDSTAKKSNDKSKMKYRCKLCGQPKQNHVCPYQQSLQRSIGINVYPVVNAFTADEPGMLATPLQEMNNFVLLGKTDDSRSGSDINSSGGTHASSYGNNNRVISPGRIDTVDSFNQHHQNYTPHRSPYGQYHHNPYGHSNSPNNITPEVAALRSTRISHSDASQQNNNLVLSPGSSVSFSPHGTPHRSISNSRDKRNFITPSSSARSMNRNNNNKMLLSNSRSSIPPGTPHSNRFGYSSSSISSPHPHNQQQHNNNMNSSSGYARDSNNTNNAPSTELQSYSSLFLDTMEIKHEQYRIITPHRRQKNQQQKIKKPNNNIYTYLPLPLPYTQRKKLSDTLFSLSKEIPQLTDECAMVLREAREYDMWDQAVAELMAQIVVIVHCSNDNVNDNNTMSTSRNSSKNVVEVNNKREENRLIGLKKYLLILGIAC